MYTYAYVCSISIVLDASFSLIYCASSKWWPCSFISYSRRFQTITTERNVETTYKIMYIRVS